MSLSSIYLDYFYLILGIILISFLLKFCKKITFINKYYKIILITVLYGFITFFNLGSFNLANTTYDPLYNQEEIVIEVEESFNKIYAIAGIGDNNLNNGKYQIYMQDIDLYGSNDLTNYSYITTLNQEEFYKYLIIDIDNSTYKYIKLVFNDKNSVMSELWFLNDDNIINYRIIDSTSNDAYKINDEQDTIAINPTFLDETYFDEVYHARNAYEIANGQKMYTAVHPLFGTSLIALGVKIFGFNPFGYRFMGALFSTLLVPLIYLLAKEFFNEKWSLFVSILFNLDFMHYTTGRIATLEPFSVFFIVLMFYMMIKAIKYDYTTNMKKHFKYLAFSGLAMALAISTKWTGAYGAIGLATIYFIFNIKYFIKAYQNKDKHLFKKTFYLFLWSVLFFVIIPILIYTISFIWIPMYANRALNIKEFIEQVIEYNTYMFTYHTGLESSHPFASKWYMWLFDIRPIWYYVNRGSSFIQTISCFNNPIINISSLIALVYLIYYNFKNKVDFLSISLIVMYLANLIPWIFISRTSFAYHYYPCIPFLIIILVYVIKLFYNESLNKDKFKRIIKIFLFINIVVFILFFPVISGLGTSYPLVQKILRWLPSWYFG